MLRKIVRHRALEHMNHRRGREAQRRVDPLDGLDSDRHLNRTSSDLMATSAAWLGNVRVSVS